MAKKRRKRKQQGTKTSRAPVPDAKRHTQTGRTPFSVPVIGAAVAIVAVLAVAGWLAFANRRPVSDTEKPAPAGQTALRQVESFPCPSRDHVQPGIDVYYPMDPPVCGQHYATWVKPGFYTTEQVPEEVVHSLEHGYVVIYYDQPEPAVLQTLQDLAERFTGEWDGVVVVPRPGLGQGIILTAWGKMLRLDTFDEDVVMAFLDAYRGRGPEHPVR